MKIITILSAVLLTACKTPEERANALEMRWDNAPPQEQVSILLQQPVGHTFTVDGQGHIHGLITDHSTH